MESGVLDIFPQATAKALTSEGVNLMKGATDEPVTSDIKRLIRAVGSLHGKSGLQVVALTRSELEDFDPLVDAVPSHYAHEPIRVRMEKGIETDMMGETFNLKPGENTVPEYLAVSLMCRGAATLASGTPDDGTRERA